MEMGGLRTGLTRLLVGLAFLMPGCGRLGFESPDVGEAGAAHDATDLTCTGDCTWSSCGFAPGANTLAAYGFEEESGGRALTDFTGDHPATMVGGDPIRTQGPWGCGDALLFAGDRNVYGEISDSPAWHTLDGARLGLWVRFDAGGRAMGFLSRDAAGMGAGHLRILRWGDDRVCARLQSELAEHGRCAAVPMGRWLELSLRFGPPDFELLVDGVPAADSGATGPTTDSIVGNSNPWSIGVDSSDSIEGETVPTRWPLVGALDELRIERGRASALAPEVTTLALVDADQDVSVGPLGSVTTIDLALLPTRNLAIRASTDPGRIGSVRFELDGTGMVTTTNEPPYAFPGSSGGDYARWAPEPGTHTLVVTPYSGPDGSGTAGVARTIALTVR